MTATITLERTDSATKLYELISAGDVSVNETVLDNLNYLMTQEPELLEFLTARYSASQHTEQSLWREWLSSLPTPPQNDSPRVRDEHLSHFHARYNLQHVAYRIASVSPHYSAALIGSLVESGRHLMNHPGNLDWNDAAANLIVKTCIRVTSLRELCDFVHQVATNLDQVLELLLQIKEERFSHHMDLERYLFRQKAFAFATESE